MGFVWWIPILVAIVAGVIAFMTTSAVDDVYVSRALLVVPEDATASPETFGDLAQNAVVLRETIRQLRIPTDEAGLANAVEIDVRGQLVEVRARATDASGARILLETLVSQLVFLTPNLLGEQGPTVVQQPQAPADPEGNGEARNAGLAVAGGLLGGILIAVMLARRELHLETAGDFELLSGWPVIGVIAHSGRGDRGPGPHLVRTSPEYGDLAEAISQASRESSIRTLLITSGRSGQGASTVAASLAAALAERGASVTLVDADLHAPSIHRLFGLGNNRGLANVLSAGLSAPESSDIDPRSVAPPSVAPPSVAPQPVVLSATGAELRVLTSGLLPPDPAQVLQTEAFASVLEELAEANDFVIVDAPPIGEHPETAVLATLCDGILLAVASESMLSGPMVRVVEALDQPNIPVPGIVVVRAGDEAVAEFAQRLEASSMTPETETETAVRPEGDVASGSEAMPALQAEARSRFAPPPPTQPPGEPGLGQSETETETPTGPVTPLRSEGPAALPPSTPERMPSDPVPATPPPTPRPPGPLRPPDPISSEPRGSESAMPPEEIPPWLRPRPRAARRNAAAGTETSAPEGADLTSRATEETQSGSTTPPGSGAPAIRWSPPERVPADASDAPDALEWHHRATEDEADNSTEAVEQRSEDLPQHGREPDSPEPGESDSEGNAEGNQHGLPPPS